LPHHREEDAAVKARRFGLTLLEVLIASSILIVIALIIYAVFDSSDKTYRTQVPIKEAQIGVQKVLELAAKEATESGLDFIWGASVTGEAHPAGLNTALVWASARSGTNMFMTNASYQPIWQKCMVLIPLNNPDGTTVSLYRFTVPTTPPNTATCYPQVSVVGGTNIQITWLRVSDNGVENTSALVARSTGVMELANMQLFAVTPISTMGNPSGGPAIALDVIKLEAYVTASSPNGPVRVGTQTSIRGRN
jgi:hypothetical protein